MRDRRILEDLIAVTHPEHAGLLSSQLLSRFGSLKSMLAARGRDRLMILGGASMVEDTLQRVKAAVRHLLRDQITSRPLLPGHIHVVNYWRGVLASDAIEQFQILFPNARNGLIADEVMAIDTVSAVHVYPREILKGCIEVEASAIILVPNRPSGNPAPSQFDRDKTRRAGGKFYRHYDLGPVYRCAGRMGEFAARRISKMSGPLFSPPAAFCRNASPWRLQSERPGQRLTRIGSVARR